MRGISGRGVMPGNMAKTNAQRAADERKVGPNPNSRPDPHPGRFDDERARQAVDPDLGASAQREADLARLQRLLDSQADLKK